MTSRESKKTKRNSATAQQDPLWGPDWLRQESPRTAPEPLVVVPPPEGPPDAPKARPWLPILAGWPDEWRERWGRRANELEEAGLGLRGAEEAAFKEVLAERRAAPVVVRPEPVKEQAPLW